MDKREAAKYLLDLYQHLAEIFSEQAEKIDSEDWDGLARAVTRALGIREEIARFTKRHGPWVEQGPPGELEKIFGSIQTIQEEISQLNKQMESMLREKRNTLLHELKELRLTRKAIGKYGTKASPSPRFIDKAG